MLSEVYIRYRKTEVLRDHVRFVFNRMEGKLEVAILKEYESFRMVSKPLCSNLFDCKWAIEVSFETKRSSPPLRAL
jgi:ASC-1-like (ASCH) protein